jgi:hypothetical protein
VKVLEIKRSELRDRFDELYRILNPEAAAEARQRKRQDWRAHPRPEVNWHPLGQIVIVEQTTLI